MRYRDLKDLKYSNLFLETEKPYAIFSQHKGKDPQNLPLNKKAIKYLPPKGLQQEPVFKVYCVQYIDRLLKTIMELAQVNKSISFHCSRHTCSSILHELSRDFYTTSKLLGHRKLASTQTYTSVSESTKRIVIEMMDVF